MRDISILKSNQDAFNRAWDRLVNRANQGMCSGGMNCLYSFNGNNCVIGDMMPDDWVSSQPILSVRMLINIDDRVRNHFRAVDINFLAALQTVHDEFYYSARMKLAELASRCDLSIPS